MEGQKRVTERRNQGAILIVEDDEVLRMVLRFEFEKDGFKVREAENGKAGLASIAEMHPDIIVTDLEMPVMDGFSFISAVRITFAKTAIPIIAISAGTSEGLAEKAMAAGANQFCPKPLIAKNFLAVVNIHLPAKPISEN